MRPTATETAALFFFPRIAKPRRGAAAAGKRRGAFTLIEIMIVVAIIGILAAVAFPRFAGLLRKSQEGSLKGTLASIRSALKVYTADNEGWYPTGAHLNNSPVLSDTLVPKYLNKFPDIIVPGYHAATKNVFCHTAISPGHEHDGSGLIYDGEYPPDAEWGSLWIACTHTDSKSISWTTF